MTAIDARELWAGFCERCRPTLRVAAAAALVLLAIHIAA